MYIAQRQKNYTTAECVFLAARPILSRIATSERKTKHRTAAGRHKGRREQGIHHETSARVRPGEEAPAVTHAHRGTETRRHGTGQEDDGRDTQLLSPAQDGA